MASLGEGGGEGEGPMQQLQGDGPMRDAGTGSTLYFGNLHPCVTVPALQDICSYFGPVEQVKIIKDKGTGMGAGYGFVKFADRRCANVALQYLNNKVLFGQEMRVNWAFQSHQREDTSTHWHLFVGDLGQDVTDAVLFAAFSYMPGCSDARVMWDHATGRSKGYGFVAMRSREEAQAAIERMHGQVIGSRRVRCGWAQHKQDESVALVDPDEVDHADPANTNVYVGNIAPDWQEADINSHFASFGPVLEVKLHKKGGYGFVRYRDHKDAVRAIVETNTKVMFGRPVKCSWGKNATGQRQSAAAAAAAAASLGAFGAVGFGPAGGPQAAGPPGGGAGGALYGLGPSGLAGVGAPQAVLMHAGVGGPLVAQGGMVAPAGVLGGGPGGGGPGVALMAGGPGDPAGFMAGYMGPPQVLAGAPGGPPGQLGQPPVMYVGPQPPGGGGGGPRLGGGGGGGGGPGGLQGVGGYGPGPGDGQGGPPVYYQPGPGAGAFAYYGAQ
ncbi:oligouridylate-binding protein-like [Raphidocelis subcapitata]|uniref:Oligouridylate-binding protein-like n=1 Tax=Raphidocelis subcapitata TaxID=307507 RepID=A0A2V0NQI3_9CHLO|nr:oligouridylate-binding protein-like [Raphidocelis subcapitata]|eukprot:GBF89891.1 oligouridylate-binding protein-like [Raphidocelis subcapitata]